MSNVPTLDIRVMSMSYEADGVLSLDLRPLNGDPLPSFAAGAHIDLHLPNGLIRSYSLSNDQRERHRYVIGVGLDVASRGGSRYVHAEMRPGQVLSISPPRNNFPLEEGAGRSVLFAGGIGVTPMLAMVRRLATLGRDWTLYYCVRQRRNAGFLAELAQLAADKPDALVLNFDGEPGGKLLDIAAAVRNAGDAHFYCCGPTPMIKAFEAATTHLPEGRTHVEYFAGVEAPATGGGYVVELARSGKSIPVPEGKTILDVCLDAGVDVPYSCMEGVCGSCETKVLSGEPDHRDLILSPKERASNKTMMICCSGAKSGRLVLDL
ncbi:PDR/VanB family oxidoreductase [Niveispirillum sp. KHB5.9]|uniref:PDR/VanB family oxidoreductase n=1 Tax=Niveispirillum sp. KHB5.9 TaxID=3400269 RepID=UPI003A856F88